MRALSYIPAWVKNKYLLTIAGFLVWMLFFDDRDVFSTYFRQRTEENNLLQSKVYFEKQIRETREELDQLKLNTATIEKYAREKYLMKRDNEDLFLMTAQ
ncbi:MAG: septum formation initiator family protein [Gemmatimonadaceae bacterium]|nr:septum formation initiator family protein [Chitinophagaceae bacterium]